MSEDSGPTNAGRTTGTYAGIWTWLVSLAATAGLICIYARWGWQGRGDRRGARRNGVGCSPRLAVWIADGRGLALRAGLRVLAASLLVTAGIGLVAVFGIAGVCVVLLLAGSAPGLTALVRRQWPPRPPAVAPGGAQARDHPSSLVAAADFSGEAGRPGASRAPRDRRSDVVPRLAGQLRPAQRRQVDGGSPFRRSAAGDVPRRAVSAITSRARCVVRLRSSRIQQPAPLPHRPGQSS